MTRAVEFAVGTFGRLDAVVHNATSRHSSVVGPLSQLEPEVFDDHLAVSIGGAFNCAKAALPYLRQRAGRMVFMTSPAAMEGSATLPAYGTVKVPTTHRHPDGVAAVVISFGVWLSFRDAM